MKSVLFVFLVVASLPALSVLKKGEMMYNVDFSYTDAKGVWLGNDDIASYNGGRTETLNYGAEFSYGTGFWGIEAKLRLDYTSSQMLNGSGGDAKANDMESKLSYVTLSLSKNAYKSSRLNLDVYFNHANALDNEPSGTQFLAVNDFSNHNTLGVSGTYFFTSKFFNFLDLSYTNRTATGGFDDFPSEVYQIRETIGYMYDRNLSFGVGIVWNQAEDGLTIDEGDWDSEVAKRGHAPFYAVKERFLARTFYVNYNLSSKKWIGFTSFEKLSGRNTDVSRTSTVYYGHKF